MGEERFWGLHRGAGKARGMLPRVLVRRYGGGGSVAGGFLLGGGRRRERSPGRSMPRGGGHGAGRWAPGLAGESLRESQAYRGTRGSRVVPIYLGVRGGPWLDKGMEGVACERGEGALWKARAIRGGSAEMWRLGRAGRRAAKGWWWLVRIMGDRDRCERRRGRRP